MGSGETVLVTAAAGGTGQFAVQLAKLAGNTVVATCGDEAKAALLARLGVDRVINYRWAQPVECKVHALVPVSGSGAARAPGCGQGHRLLGARPVEKECKT
jgi:NADPH:quinone reductase-like Zn-dependent oxidoreductase